jgi:hypothetical protein
MKLDTDRDVYSEMNIEVLPFPTLAVLDLETQKIVYERDTEWNWTPDYWHYWFDTDTGRLLNTALGSRGGPLSNILGLGNNLLVRKHLSYACDDACEDILIAVSDEQVIETSIAGSIEAYLPDSDQLLIRDNPNTYLIYEIADGTTKPLFTESYRQTGYRVYIEGVVGGNRLSILLNSTIHYTIRIPQ